MVSDETQEAPQSRILLPRILLVDPQDPSPTILREAATLLQNGRLVAFPTETVYGLGANALDPTACRRIFAAKGRPSTNPLIVHVAHPEAAKQIAHWTNEAELLAAAFWPGPITFVLKRKATIPDEVTAGGDTVAIRIPDHPVALGLLKATGLPIAAPSANRSNAVSPTRAAHVAQSLGDQVDLILDGGPCQVGIESTVIDLTCQPPQILRPGQLGPTDLAKTLGIRPRISSPSQPHGIARSPGQLARHYAPHTPIEVLGNLGEARSLQEQLEAQHQKVLIVAGEPGPGILNWGSRSADWAQNLYESFHRFDAERWDRVILVPPGQGEEWAGVLDRLTRAAKLP